jgi:hypothetical protein
MTRLYIIILWALMSAGIKAAPIPKSSFGIVCKDEKNSVSLRPLSFFEFSDQTEIRINKNYINLLEKVAPLTFKNLGINLSAQKIVTSQLDQPETSEVDPLAVIPINCAVVTMIKEELNQTDRLVVNQKYWGQLSKEYQDFFIFDFIIQKYLDPNLTKVDYRRFTMFIVNGEFDNYNLLSKIDFFKTYGINEFLYGGISLNIKEEINFYDDQNIQDAIPFKGSTYMGGLLNEGKFVSFYKNQVIKAISTSTPFKKTINAQEFQFFIPKDLKDESATDQRTEPRMKFYEDGSVQAGMIKPIDHFFNLITEMKSDIGYLVITFHPNHEPEFINMGECNIYMNGCEGSGKITYNNKSFKVSYVKWHDNKIFSRLIFSKHAVVEIPGNGKHDLQELYFDRDGVSTSAWPNP